MKGGKYEPDSQEQDTLRAPQSIPVAPRSPIGLNPFSTAKKKNVPKNDPLELNEIKHPRKSSIEKKTSSNERKDI